jgi:uncharacterized membrane protein YeaQ/YmgE (transglycosylase-associated protein family)
MALELALLLLAVVAAIPAVRAASGPAQLWHASVSLSLFRFLLYRWVLRWVLWAILLGALARFDLQLIGVHPDRAGGISILAQPTRALGVVGLALGSVLSAAWGTRMLHGVRLPELYPSIAGYVVFFLLLALAPLLLFLRPLARARRRGLYDYGLLAQRYGCDFSERWFGSPVESPLGSPDIQSLSDLAGGFEVVRQMRPLPFSGQVVVELAVLALLPVAPLFVAAVPARELAVRLIGLLF